VVCCALCGHLPPLSESWQQPSHTGYTCLSALQQKQRPTYRWAPMLLAEAQYYSGLSLYDMLQPLLFIPQLLYP